MNFRCIYCALFLCLSARDHVIQTLILRRHNKANFYHLLSIPTTADMTEKHVMFVLFLEMISTSLNVIHANMSNWKFFLHDSFEACFYFIHYSIFVYLLLSNNFHFIMIIVYMRIMTSIDFFNIQSWQLVNWDGSFISVIMDLIKKEICIKVKGACMECNIYLMFFLILYPCDVDRQIKNWKIKYILLRYNENVQSKVFFYY